MRFDSNNLNNGPIEVESMVYKRWHHGCTLFRSSAHYGRPVIIAAGSWRGSGINTAEIWDFSQDGTSWQESKLVFFSVSPLFFKGLIF